NKYQLFAGPKISHEVLVSPGTSMRAVIQPALAKPLILEKLGPQAPPEWLLSRVIPYEAAILCSPDLDAKRFDVVLFLNPQRLTPLVAENAASLGIPRRIPFVKWNSDGFDTSKPGVLS